MSSNQYHDWVSLELDNTAVYVKLESPDRIVSSASGRSATILEPVS